MNFDRLLRNGERLSDIPIPISFCHVSQDLSLANCQRVIAHVLGQMRGYLGGDPFSSSVYLSDDIHHFAWRHAFKQVSPSPGLQGALDLNIAFERCEHDYSGIPELSSDCRDNIDSTKVWKPEIHERNVWAAFPILPDPFSSIAGL
jgi:hypothetical protein